MTVDEDKIIRDKIDSLEDVFAEEAHDQSEVWSRIQAKLNTGSRKKYSILQYWAAAAVILVILLVKVFNTTDQSEIVYTVEDYAAEVSLGDEVSSHTEVLAFIQSACLLELEICSTPQFKLLMNELSETDAEVARIDEMIKRYGEDFHLTHSKIKAENFRSEIVLELVQIITS